MSKQPVLCKNYEDSRIRQIQALCEELTLLLGLTQKKCLVKSRKGPRKRGEIGRIMGKCAQGLQLWGGRKVNPGEVKKQR